MNSAAAIAAGTHASTMKSAAAAAETSTSTAPRQGIIGNQTGSHKDGGGAADQTVTNHDILLCLEVPSIPWR
jgi:hypothetical protein